MGFQSNIGNGGKAEPKISSLTLPPRTPSLMPLDYAIWHVVEAKLVDCEPEGKEAQGEFIARVRKRAMSLSRACLAMVAKRMKQSLQALVKSNGVHS